MFDITSGYTTDCEGFRRRDFIKLGTIGFLGLTLPGFFRTKAANAADAVKDKACIMLWMTGGPSHLDIFDPKPNAAQNIHGPFGAIKTNVPGIEIGEHMPLMAKQMDKVALVRSVTHPRGDHEGAHHYMLTGNNTAPAFEHPALGSVVAYVKGDKNGLPPNIAVPGTAPWYMGAGFLGVSYNPYVTGGDPNAPNFKVRDIALPGGISSARVERRRDVLDRMDKTLKTLEAHNDGVRSADKFTEKAYDVILSPTAKKAFNLSEEPAKVRDTYGRNTFGQSCLLARRLVEAGVRFVTVETGGWDTHSNNFDELKNGRLPIIDKGFAALLQDLHQRGLLESTVVMWMGEFGRTPQINGTNGRDHWPYAQTVALAGGGIKGGQVYGSTNERAEVPKDNPCKPDDVAATVLHCLGIDHQTTIPSPGGRPMYIVRDGEVLRELV